MDKENTVDYDILIENAMRDVVKYALKKIQKTTDKNFCFMFHINTKNKGVILPENIKKQYPEEITIILQHQFANLDVKNNKFSVDLSFGKILANITIPFSSILIFSDQEAGLELSFNQYKGNYIEDDELDSYLDDDNFEDIKEVNNNIDIKHNLINFNNIVNKE